MIPEYHRNCFFHRERSDPKLISITQRKKTCPKFGMYKSTEFESSSGTKDREECPKPIPRVISLERLGR